MTADADEARVAVTSAMSPYRRVGPAGTVAMSGTAPRTVVLRLRWTPGGGNFDFDLLYGLYPDGFTAREFTIGVTIRT